MENQNEVTILQRIIAALVECGWFLGFGWLIFPLVVWLLTSKSKPFVSHHAKQSFFWQLLLFILIAAMIVAYCFITDFNTEVPTGFIVALIIIAVPFMLCSIIATVKALSGEDYHYPLLKAF